MRHCFNSYCENGKEVEYLDDDTMVVTDEDCHICHGTGEVEDTLTYKNLQKQLEQLERDLKNNIEYCKLFE